MTRAAILAICLCLLAACAGKDGDVVTGYVEGETLMIGPQDAGAVASVDVKEGDSVAAGALLFSMDKARAELAWKQAEATAAAAKARAADAGSLDQRVAEAAAQFENARKSYERTKKLVRTHVAPGARLDADRAAFESARARLEGARADRDGAESDLAAASAAAALAKRRLDDLSVTAPKAGTIEEIYRRPGEVIAPGEPVVALLPPENMKIRFYAPEEKLSSLKIGAMVDMSCDGCAPRKARISFIAASPQFTPPVIYNLKERKKLVFLIEARPADPSGLHPGLPVDVKLP
ncbi:MAG: HlyD family efflux transporter periplasmic adaptor subunit [Alphaproteobacteria bacterium]|nr:HlyD family efflux transporter periplasmic adaptor subunit [Alphaproteobacteria bacterium]